MRIRLLYVLIITASCGFALGNGGFELPPAKSGHQYEVDLTEVLRQNHLRIDSDAAAPQLRWSMDPKGAPAGLKLLPDGILTGTPQVAQPWHDTLMVQVRDKNLGPDSLSLKFFLTVERPRLRLVRTAPQLVPLAKPQPSAGATPTSVASAAAQSGRVSAQSAPSGFKVILETPDEKSAKLSFAVTPPPGTTPEVWIWVEESSEDARKAAKENCPKAHYPQTFKEFIEDPGNQLPEPLPGRHEHRQKQGTLDPDRRPGQYSIELFKPLGACDAVFAQVSIGATKASSPPVLAQPLPRPKTPVLQAEVLVEGNKSVKGSTTKGVSVEISVNGHVKKTATADKATGAFSVELDEALKADDKVAAEATLKSLTATSQPMTVLAKTVLDKEGWAEGKNKASGTASKGASVAILVNDTPKASTTADNTTGRFHVTLDEPLKANDQVIAQATPNGVSLKSDPVTVSRKPKLFESNLVEGNKTISGEASPEATITFEINGELQDETATADKNSGKFSKEMGSALGAGDKVAATATLNGVEIKSDPLIVRSQTFDLGRTRFFFSTGVILSKKNDDFSEQDPFLAFNSVTNWWRSKPKPWDKEERPRNSRKTSPSSRRKESEEETEMENGKEKENGSNLGGLEMSRFWFDTFLDVQLTSIPVEMENMQNNVMPRQDTDDPLATFLSSRQSAVLQTGFYWPIVTTVWKSPNPNALFVAPIVKVGLQTTTEEDGMPVDPQKNAPSLGTDDVFNFFSIGVRIGNWDLTSLLSKTPNKLDRGRTPRMLSHIDLLWGKWENFEVIRLNENDEEIRRRPWRFNLAGRLKIPRVPLYVGLDANLSIEQGEDDVRFLFGTNFDIGNLFKKLSIPK